MSMFGKMSVGVRRADATPKIMINSAITMNVYGRQSASLTMPIMMAAWGSLPQIPSSFGEPCGAGQHEERNGKYSRSHLIAGRQPRLGGHHDRHDRNGPCVAD